MLIDRLKEIQQREGWFDAGMALKIGCTRQMYQMVRTKKAKAGREFLAGVLKAFPELKDEVWQYMTNSAETHHKPHRGWLRWLLG